MWWYLRQVLDDRLGPIVGGAIWGFCAYRFSHVLHLQLQALYFLPLAFGALHRVVARLRWQDGAWLGLWFGLTVVSSVYYAVIGLVALGLGGIALVAGTGRVSLGRLIAPLAVGGAVAPVAIVTPVPCRTCRRSSAKASSVRWTRRPATPRPPVSFISEPPWRPMPFAPIAPHRGGRPAARVGALLLAALSLAALARSRRQPLLWTWGAVAAAPESCSHWVRKASAPSMRFAHRWVFGFQAVRAPARFGVLLVVRCRRGGWVRCHVVAPRTAARMAPRCTRPVVGRGDRGSRVAGALCAGADIRDACQCLAA